MAGGADGLDGMDGQTERKKRGDVLPLLFFVSFFFCQIFYQSVSQSGQCGNYIPYLTLPYLFFCISSSIQFIHLLPSFRSHAKT